MEELTKRRAKAFVIDSIIATAVGNVLSYMWRKRTGKSSFVSEVAIPYFTMWGLELMQMKWRGRTIGHDKAGIRLESMNRETLGTIQLVKRMVHRETLTQLLYLTRRSEYQVYEGTRFPHDLYAGTIVKSVD